MADMGRGKIRISRIENKTTRQVTFAKRRAGLLKKTHELAVLCEAQIGLIIFSSNGKLYEYLSSDASSMESIIKRYRVATGTSGGAMEHNGTEEVEGEVRRLRKDTRNLEMAMERYTGQDLTSAGLDELHQLERMLDHSLQTVRARKIEVLQQQMENLQRSEKMMEHENAQIYHMIQEQEAAGKEMMMGVGVGVGVGSSGDVVRALLEQFPFSGEPQPESVLHLLPTHPNLHHY